MKNLSNIFRGIALLAVLLSAGAAPVSAQAAAESGPRAVVPQRVYDFGDVNKGEPLVHVFAIRNEGTADLDLLALPGG